MTSQGNHRSSLRRFIDDYRRVRLAEGYAPTSPDFVRALPFRDLTGRNAGAWRIRALHYLVVRVGLAALPGVERVLDLGAGNGWLARRLAGAFRVTALDVDDGDTGLASIRDPRVARVAADLTSLPLRAGSFDAVIAAASLHYAPDVGAALHEAARVLRPRGLLIIADSPVYADASARQQAWQRTRSHYAGFGAEHLAERYHGLTRAELDAPRLFRFVTVSPGVPWRARLRPWRIAAGPRLPVLFGWKR